MIARAVVALESIAASFAASLKPTIAAGHAGPPPVCTGSGQAAHGLPLDATACGTRPRARSISAMAFALRGCAPSEPERF